MQLFFVNQFHVLSVNIFILFVEQLGFLNVYLVKKLNNFEIKVLVGKVILNKKFIYIFIILNILILDTNLTDFIYCPFNSAINRQTRMLSSSITNCLSSSFTYSNLIDLKTAKKNLESMEFFGLTEYLHLSQRLFEQTKFCKLFQICSFQIYLEQDLTNNQTYDYLKQNLTFNDLNQLRQINSDDIELYQFAKKLFFQRTCQTLGIACQ